MQILKFGNSGAARGRKLTQSGCRVSSFPRSFTAVFGKIVLGSAAVSQVDKEGVLEYAMPFL